MDDDDIIVFPAGDFHVRPFNEREGELSHVKH